MFIALGVLTALFLLLVTIRSVSDRTFCVLCVSVSGTWLFLLGLFFIGRYEEPIIIALLIGQSIVGVYYRLQATLPDRFEIFTLPYILTATVGGYLLLSTANWSTILIALGIVWLVASLGYYYRENQTLRTYFDAVIACCRDW